MQSPDFPSVSAYFSRELVNYVRKVGGEGGRVGEEGEGEGRGGKKRRTRKGSRREEGRDQKKN